MNEIQIKALVVTGWNTEGGCTELYLTEASEIQIYAEDAHEGHTFTYSLQQAEEIMAGLGRLIWLAKHPENDN
jgi:hypothetical protein